MTAALFPDLVVNGETLPHALVAAEVQNHAAPEGKPGIAWRKAARAMAVRTLLLQEARKRGIATRPRKLGKGVEAKEEALIRGLLEAELVVEVPSKDEVRTEWARDPSRFRAPPLWEVSHILVACDPRDPESSAKARTRADTLVHELRDDPSKFAILAAQHSDCPSKTTGGFLGQIGPRDTVPEFEAALRELSARLITAQEDERQRISRELHDDFSQRLALLAIDIAQLRDQLPRDVA